MTLEEKAYIATLRVRKVHAEIELIDYQKVMKYYDPDIPAFGIILDKVMDIQDTISRLDKAMLEI
jgi:hypothetical protein